ncbi:endonuclease V [Polyangium aurulentum]|uniref:endonuclease V n=1 Tax=Polyangium aurulentum TaxID=2567896 RepID=UPI0010AE7BD4|nr:endonuclease V [Polyangium aurulentum]UQA62712.1 endonuclease V [Polyangium aurulentum]
MLAAVDVSYGEREAVAACVVFGAWEDATGAHELTARIDSPEPYVPGAFYKRELPCILAVLAKVGEPLEVVVVDGYVWLSGEGRKGLGAHLFEALGGRVVVVGVAKTGFAGASHAIAVLRGKSEKPLHVTAAGVPVETAASWVARMHGKDRMPTLLRRVDRLCRDALAAGSLT